ncbi:PH domain-containing protein [Candidatus Poribacteria bacterium]|nr:PH domain-containing protein [Candidatus Poribacteria bacterium]
MDPNSIFAIERPHPKLMRLYLIRSFLLPPISLLGLPILYFRYHTMRYRFDSEGISMRWGILFRREVNLTYARIQDIHLTSGFIQRWLGLADIHIQTASGSAAAEMTIEGLLEYEDVRTFLYSKMRGYKDPAGAKAPPVTVEPGPLGAGEADLAAALHVLAGELRGARMALERLAEEKERNHV